MTKQMYFKLNYTGDDIWRLILCLEDRNKAGKNNSDMKEFLDKELKRLHELHERFGALDEISHLGAELIEIR